MLLYKWCHFRSLICCSNGFSGRGAGRWPCWHLFPGSPLVEEQCLDNMVSQSRLHGTCFSPGLVYVSLPFCSCWHRGLVIILLMQKRRPRLSVQQFPGGGMVTNYRLWGLLALQLHFLGLLDYLRLENVRVCNSGLVRISAWRKKRDSLAFFSVFPTQGKKRMYIWSTLPVVWP